MKFLLNVIGVLAVVLGVLGMFLPLLPTVPFLLLASACFARGSDKLHRALLGSALVGPLLRDYEQGKGMPAKAKWYAVLLLWGSLGFGLYRIDSLPLRSMLVLVGAGVTVYLWKFVPTMKRAPR